MRLDDAQFFQIARALADPKRFELLQRIVRHREAPTCSDMVDELGLAKATVSHHISELAGAGLIEVRREAKFAYLSARDEILRAFLAETSRRLRLQ